MIKKYYFTFIMLLNVLFFTVSCSSNNDEENYVNTQNKAFAGSKWTLTDWDYSIGDDYIGLHNYTINIFFYSDTEGLIYYGNKDNYSDIGSSTYRAVAFFNYNATDDKIEIDYITERIQEANFTYFTIEGDQIVAKGYHFLKNKISSDDNAWIATLHGKTGECVWYYDLHGMLYIIGNGNMADYSSPNATPWADCKFNMLDVDEGVTSIGDNAFAFISLGEVNLPRKSLTHIGKNAFSGSCISEIHLNDNITEIEEGAFNGCKYLEKVYLPENIEFIGDFAFSDCKSASLYLTPHLKEIGKYAFFNCEVNRFTESNVLEKVGECAFTDLAISKLTLPNSLVTVEHLAFNGNFKEIYIGTGLTNVIGTPFYPTSNTGKIYVNLGNPITLDRNILEPASGWTLYVPEGCKSAYSKAPYWKNFKNIIEDNTLVPGNGIPDEDEEDKENDDLENTTIPKTYSNAGNTFQWIKVERSTIPTFYIMQTELDVNSNFKIDEDKNIGILNSNSDVAVIKTEFRNFLEKIKEITGIQMRLPTREEWEYAAKGGNKSKGYIYSGSNSIDEVAWYKDNSHNSIQNFASKQPNELGIYDMSGNYGELTNNNMNDPANVDGYIYGGCFSDEASSCKVTSCKQGLTSGNISGSNIKEKNAFDTRKITVRLVFTAPY